ncbi:TolC family protein [bacterium]|nr:TolC family protein [bacterium]
MSKWMTLSLSLLLTCIVAADAPSKDDPLNENILWDSISQEVESHPDVRVAEAELRLAESRLQLARMKVGEAMLKNKLDLSSAEKKLAATKASLAAAQAIAKETQELFRRGAESDATRRKAEVNVHVAESDLHDAMLQISLLKMQELMRKKSLNSSTSHTSITKVYPIGDIQIAPERVMELLKTDRGINPVDSMELQYLEASKTLVITASRERLIKIEAQLDLLRRAGNAFAPK